MTDEPENTSLAKLTVDVAVAFISHHPIAPDQVKNLLLDILGALQTGPAAGPGKPFAAAVDAARAVEVEQATLTPAVDISQSVTDEYLYSLEDGQPYRSLRRHLAAKHGMTPDDYRRKWGLPDDYPMVAPSYARERSEVAKRIGLGRASQAHQKTRAS